MEMLQRQLLMEREQSIRAAHGVIFHFSFGYDCSWGSPLFSSRPLNFRHPSMLKKSSYVLNVSWRPRTPRRGHPNRRRTLEASAHTFKHYFSLRTSDQFLSARIYFSFTPLTRKNLFSRTDNLSPAKNNLCQGRTPGPSHDPLFSPQRQRGRATFFLSNLYVV